MPDLPRPPLPVSDVIVAVLAIIVGARDAYDIYADFQQGMISINLGVLCLPLGVGVLLRSNGCRVVLAGLVLLALVLIPLGMCIITAGALSGKASFYVTWSGEKNFQPDAAQVVISYAMMAGAWLINLWTFRVLRSDRTRAAVGLPPRLAI